MTPGCDHRGGHRGGRRGYRGFTLVELIASMVVLAIVGGVSSSILLHSADGYLAASTTSQLHHELSVAMDRLARELRRIDRDPAAATIAPHIDAVTATSMAWRDADGDALSLDLMGDVLWFAAAGGPPRVLLRDVAAFAIRTYDEDSGLLPSSLSADACDAIRRVEVSITLARSGGSEMLTARVFIRSTMSGA